MRPHGVVVASYLERVEELESFQLYQDGTARMPALLPIVCVVGGNRAQVAALLRKL